MLGFPSLLLQKFGPRKGCAASAHCSDQGFEMALSKTEVNLRRLLAAAPQQHNQAKLIYYVSTLREQLEQLAGETTPEGLPRVSKAILNDYSEKIEAVASRLAASLLDVQETQEPLEATTLGKSSSKTQQDQSTSYGLRRRYVPSLNDEDRPPGNIETDSSGPVKLDVTAQAHIEKHRKLQEDLTDEMVDLAKQLKESSLLMSHSIQNTEKILDSTEHAVEHSLARTSHASKRAMEINSESFKTTCLTWLIIFVMTSIFIMVVLLIRVT